MPCLDHSLTLAGASLENSREYCVSVSVVTMVGCGSGLSSAGNAMAAFLYRASGSPAFTPPTRARFSDVPVGTAFRTEIEWLASTGTTTGYADGTYRPLSPVNRDAMAAFLYRRAG